MSAFPNVSFLLCTALIAITLAVSGFAKAKDPSSTITGILNLGLEKIAPLKLTARTLPWAELLLALGMLAAPGALFTVISGISLMLMLFYLIVIARALATGRTAGCNCFGSKSAAPVSRYTLIRNIALTAAAAAVFTASLGTEQALIYELYNLNAADWGWVLGAALIALTMWAVQRGEALAEPDCSESDDNHLLLPVYEDRGDGEEYVRMPIPYATLHTLDGKNFSIRELAELKARVLFFVSPTCGACLSIFDKLAGWAHKLPQLELHPVFSSVSNAKTASVPESITPLIDPKFAAMHAFGRGTPLAVVLGSDGLLAGGPVRGASDVSDVMDQLIEEFTGAESSDEHSEQNTVGQMP